MRRDMDMIRAIVLAIHDHDGQPSATDVQSLVGNFDHAVFGYHIQLLLQAEMLTGVDTGVRKDRHGIATLALTWSGQDFAGNIANDDVWAGAQKTLDDAELKSASFAVWTQILDAKITERLSGV